MRWQGESPQATRYGMALMWGRKKETLAARAAVNEIFTTLRAALERIAGWPQGQPQPELRETADTWFKVSITPGTSGLSGNAALDVSYLLAGYLTAQGWADRTPDGACIALPDDWAERMVELAQRMRCATSCIPWYDASSTTPARPSEAYLDSHFPTP